MLLHTAGGDVLQETPTLYQDVGGTRAWWPAITWSGATAEIGFAVDGADHPTKELVLDPTLAFSTYLGGSGNDYGNAIAVDLLGNSYLVGTTASTNFPTQNGYQSSLSGMQDAFLAKLNPQGTALVYATYLAGAPYNDGSGLAIAVDNAGDAYITGGVSGSNFPVTTGAFQTAYNGFGQDAFVPSWRRRAMPWSTRPCWVARAPIPAPVSPWTGWRCLRGGHHGLDRFSHGQRLPVQRLRLQQQSVFVTKLNPSGSSLDYSTYLAGTSADQGSGIAVDAAALLTSRAGRSPRISRRRAGPIGPAWWVTAAAPTPL